MKNKNTVVLTALALSAASALIYEIVATNILFFYFTESSYSLATVLSIFLFGLGIGSFGIYLFSSRIKNKKLLFGFLQILIAIYAFFILTNLQNIIEMVSALGTFFVSFILLFFPTIFLGAIFPLANSLIEKKREETVGLVYTVDLIGAITGSLIAGFLLIPMHGHTITVMFTLTLNLISAFLIFDKKYKVITIILAIFFISLQILFYQDPVLTKKETQKELLIPNTDTPATVAEDLLKRKYHANSPYGVVELNNGILKIDKKTQCKIYYSENESERMMANYALDNLEKKNNIKVLNIGLGCGLTAQRALEYSTTLDIVEINEKVAEANKLISNVQENDRVNLIIDDGLKYLRETNNKYDTILIDIQNPTVSHSSYLYTAEAFRLVKNALNNGGTFSLWHYDGGTEYLDILYYSLKESFNFVYEYDGVFLATDQRLNERIYIPTTPYKINTVNKNTLLQAYK